MSILIKGRKPPNSCDDCWVSDCPNDEHIEGYRMMDRPKYCPLVTIPPHGRLIDADVMIENCMKEDSFLAEMLFRKVNNAPTIILAEGGE